MRAIALLLVAVLLCLFCVMIFGAVKVTRAPRRPAASRPPAATPGAQPAENPASSRQPSSGTPETAPRAPDGRPPVTRETLPLEHPLVQALYAAAEPQLARERQALEQAGVAAETGETTGYRRLGKASYRVDYRVTPTGRAEAPYRATLTLAWERSCSPLFPTWQQASLAPLRRKASGTVTLEYFYQQGVWTHQSTQRRRTIR